jgi:hypothetical protein
MAWMPGAIRKEITKFRTPLRRRRGVCLHVAVSESASLYGFFSGAKVCSHFYVRKDGTIEQYVSTAYQAPANYQGNSSLISVETQGGVHNANSEPWTAAQVEALARISAWASKTHGIPLIEMPNSRPESVGIGYHKLGVDPYRVDGGERWSTSYGKICPGAGKIAQVDRIILRARQILAGDPGLPDTGTPEKEWDEVATKAEVVQAVIEGIAASAESGTVYRAETTQLTANGVLRALRDSPNVEEALFEKLDKYFEDRLNYERPSGVHRVLALFRVAPWHQLYGRTGKNFHQVVGEIHNETTKDAA